MKYGISRINNCWSNIVAACSLCLIVMLETGKSASVENSNIHLYIYLLSWRYERYCRYCVRAYFLFRLTKRDTGTTGSCGWLPYYSFNKVSVLLTNMKGFYPGEKKSCGHLYKRCVDLLAGLRSHTVKHAVWLFVDLVDMLKDRGM